MRDVSVSAEDTPRAIAVAGNQSTTIDVTEALLRAGYRVQYVINVGPEKAATIADYIDLSRWAAERHLTLIRPATYAMKDEATVEMFRDLELDVIISVGWQRLIPEWLLSRLTIGAFGMHGSAEPLPRGRGRSPMVWSIIEGRDRFLTNLFRYDAGVDSGAVVATQRFDVAPWDTIRSLQHKNALAQVRLLLDHLPAILAGTATYTPQPSDVEPTYYPKREPADGVIDWNDSATLIWRLVRGVTRPYPGAFTFDEDVKIFIWAANPFDEHLRFDDAAPGEIVAAFHDATFVVRTSDSTLYVTDWEADRWTPRVGTTLRSHTNPSWEKLKTMRQEG